MAVYNLEMQTPRILAIADVHLRASASRRPEIVAFYRDFLCLEQENGPENSEQEACSIFRGQERVGPRLVVTFEDQDPPVSVRRDVLLEMESLTEIKESLTESRIPFEQFHGFSFYDRRLAVADPSGHRIEMVTRHWF